MPLLKKIFNAILIFRDPFHGLGLRNSLAPEGFELPEADFRYTIFFTPRSSSTRLTDIIRSSHLAGSPEEWFNPNLLRSFAVSMQTGTLESYVQALRRKPGQGGVFGVEITYFQMLMVFRSADRFMALIQPQSFIWLTRDNIIEQAISVTRMTQTKVSQSVQSTSDEISKAEQVFTYRPLAIWWALIRLDWMEARTEALFKRLGVSPLRLTYEQLANETETKSLERVLAHLGRPASPFPAPKSGHSKLSGAKSLDFATRFRTEYPRLIAIFEARRKKRQTA
jgi:LPS sulfotransferase NodH